MPASGRAVAAFGHEEGSAELHGFDPARHMILDRIDRGTIGPLRPERPRRPHVEPQRREPVRQRGLLLGHDLTSLRTCSWDFAISLAMDRREYPARWSRWTCIRCSIRAVRSLYSRLLIRMAFRRICCSATFIRGRFRWIVDRRGVYKDDPPVFDYAVKLVDMSRH